MEEFMNKNKIWIGILFSIMFIFGNTGLTYAQSSGGTLTLTDIPARFNGKYVFLEGYNHRVELIGALTYNLDNDIGSLPRIANGRVSIPMWIIIDDGRTEELARYNGNHTVEIDIYIFDSATLDWNVDEIAWVYFEFVSFRNGNATITFHDNDDFETD